MNTLVPHQTAKQFAHALGRSESSVHDRLKGVPASGALIERGREVRAYNTADLPQALRADLAESRAKLGFGSIAELLESAVGRYEPSVALGQCHPDEIERAHKLREAELPYLSKPRNPAQTEAEFNAALAAEHKMVFGYAVKPENARRLYDRTVMRDGARGQWDRLELYLPDNPKRRVEEEKPGDFTLLRVRIEKYLAKPNREQKWRFWVAVMETYDELTDEGQSPEAKKAKHKLFAFLLQNAPFVGTANALDTAFRRELQKWEASGRRPDALLDKRSQNSGRFRAPKLSQVDFDKIVARTVEYQGDLAKAWRELREQNELSPELLDYYRDDPASKSYVPKSIRKAVMTDVLILLRRHRGPRHAALNGAYVTRNPDSFAAGDWYQADDLTAEIYWWDFDENGVPFVTRGQILLMIDGQILLMIDCRSLLNLRFALIPEKNYSGFHIRGLMETVMEKWGVPRKGFSYEMGRWKDSSVVKGCRPSVTMDDIEMGLSERLGIRFRHSILARAKVIERVFLTWQSYMRTMPGWCSKDEQRKRPEKLKVQLAEIARKINPAHPDESLYSKDEWEARLEALSERYNREPQQGEYLKGLCPKEAYEKFFTTRLIEFDDDTRWLMCKDPRKVKIGRNGITFRYGKKVFNYKGTYTGRHETDDVIAHFEPAHPERLTVTDLDRQNPVTFLLSTTVDDDNMEQLSQALSEVADHEAYRKARYRVISGHFKADFEQRMFRQKSKDSETARTSQIGAQMRTAETEVKRDQQEVATKARRVRKLASEMGVSPALLNTNLDP